MTRSDAAEIHELFDEMHFIRSLSKVYWKADTPEGCAFIDQYRAERIRSLRRDIRNFYRHHQDPLRDSLLTGTQRIIWEHEKDEEPDMSDGPTYFWIYPDADLTDDEIDEIRQDESFRCTSPYDCCGQQFTWSFAAHRTPAGVVFINRTSYDY